mgnify:CR=1 FL=1|jgi:hypothetical protein
MLFYISTLVLGVIAGAFIAVIVSSCRPNRAIDLYNRLQNDGNQGNSLRRSAYNAVNVNSVLDKDDLWGNEERSADESDSSVNKAGSNDNSKEPDSDSIPSGIRFAVGGTSTSSGRTRKSNKVYIAGPGMFNASQFHGEAPEGIAVIEVEEHQVEPMVKMVLQHPDFIRQAFAMSGKMVITLDELMDIWEVLSGDKVPEGARRSARN